MLGYNVSKTSHHKGPEPQVHTPHSRAMSNRPLWDPHVTNGKAEAWILVLPLPSCVT